MGLKGLFFISTLGLSLGEAKQFNICFKIFLYLIGNNEKGLKMYNRYIYLNL